MWQAPEDAEPPPPSDALASFRSAAATPPLASLTSLREEDEGEGAEGETAEGETAEGETVPTQTIAKSIT